MNLKNIIKNKSNMLTDSMGYKLERDQNRKKSYGK
jgi:hypothetical protein